MKWLLLIPRCWKCPKLLLLLLLLMLLALLGSSMIWYWHLCTTKQARLQNLFSSPLRVTLWVLSPKQSLTPWALLERRSRQWRRKCPASAFELAALRRNRIASSRNSLPYDLANHRLPMSTPMSPVVVVILMEACLGALFPLSLTAAFSEPWTPLSYLQYSSKH